MILCRLFKIILCITVFCYSNFYFSQNDSLGKKKSQYLIFANVGYPVVNKFNLVQYHFGSGNNYWVKSKLKPLYVFGFEYHFKKFNIGLSGSYIESEFIGRDFQFNVIEQVGGSRSLPTSIAKYNLYQKMYCNVFQISLTTGVKFNIAKKHLLTTNISISSNLISDNYTSNYYSSNQLGYDTTKYVLIKNGSSQENASMFPYLGLIVSYNYKLTERFFIDCKLISQFFHALYRKDYDGKQNGIMKGQNSQIDVYSIRQNIFIAPTIGVKYKITN